MCFTCEWNLNAILIIHHLLLLLLFIYLVPPALSNLSSLVLFHRTADCAHFLVNISSAKPPVTSSLIQWSGSYQSDRSTVLLMNGVSNMTLCNLATGDTGPVTMTVFHPAATNINITFDLTVWGQCYTVTTILRKCKFNENYPRL